MAREISQQTKKYSQRLASFSSRKRKEAEEEICSMGSTGRDLLVEIMRRREAHPYNPVFYGCLCGAAGGIGGIIVLMFAGHRLGPNTSLVGNIVSTFIFTVFVSLWTAFMKANAATLLATRFRDESIIAPMSEALGYRDRTTRNTASAALIDLLPRVQAENEIELTSLQRANLHRALRSRNSDLTLAVLQGLRFLGDSSSIAPVERLANGFGIAVLNSEIHKSATETLISLRERVERAHSQATLLRPTAVPTSSSAVLLRAAGNADSKREVLLRAAGEEAQNIV